MVKTKPWFLCAGSGTPLGSFGWLKSCLFMFPMFFIKKFNLIMCIFYVHINLDFHFLFHFFIMQIEKPLQRHGGRLEHDEKYCGSCYGAEEVHLFVRYP